MLIITTVWFLDFFWWLLPGLSNFVVFRASESCLLSNYWCLREKDVREPAT
ncbi:Uncharacterized protein APZ42_017749 [Daphnia magna]|uniref:Uncharacterized protein n=1 Tax=Daphnia magna TaxID=35525 RepID=A0A164ZMD3_9CRUS|nr:Uncharacterized protein APZ42_017749 [Daphnia magna]